MSAVEAAGAAQPQQAAGKDRDGDRLEDRALLVLGPAAQARPDGRQDAGKAGRAADDAAQRRRRCHRASGPASVMAAQLGPQQAVEAEGDENGADRCAHVRCRQPAQQLDAERDADLAADQQRQQPPPVERVAQLPHRVALDDQAVADDQRRGLQGRQDVQPDRRGDQAEGEARQSGDKGAEKVATTKRASAVIAARIGPSCRRPPSRRNGRPPCSAHRSPLRAA